MRTLLVGLAMFGLLLASAALPAEEKKGPSKGSDMLLSHDVFFTLKDNSAAARQKLVEACKKYLSGHPGTVSFSAGSRAEDLARDVNDKDFDVALHLVFKDKAAHDAYQDAPRHKQFIEENKDNWKKVRVFDSYVGGTPEK
jgi:quinol monooxygenase YgiN